MKQHDNFINGEWVSGRNHVPDVNPSDTNDIIGEFAQASESQVNTAIDAANAAFPAWSQSGIQQRHDILERIASEIQARKEEIGTMLSREEGKTLAEGIAETMRAAMIFRFFAGEVLRSAGQTVESVRPGIQVEVTREAVGVVGIITPWNFPIAIPAWKIAPALAFGNCVVFKPAELVPASAWMLAEIISRSGLPAGVFNLVMGSGTEVGATIVSSDKIHAITFTGSSATGQRILEAAAKNRTKVQLEMGGKNPLVVLDDADLNCAVNAAINGAYYSTGQRCTASSRFIVTPGIYSRFIDATIEKMKALKVAHALRAGTDIGPVVDERQLKQNLRYLDIARREGGHIAFGGEAVGRDTPGFYQIPSLVTETTPDMTINREEVFGPVASVLRADDYEHALHLANSTEMGLVAGICTSSLKFASHFKRHSQSGMVMVNLPTAGVDYHVAFGGTKASSYGSREQGSYALEFYTSVKTAYSFPG